MPLFLFLLSKMLTQQNFCDILIVMNKTIAAISTPLGKGAISIVRLSGDKSLEIARKVFSCKAEIEPRKLILGDFNLGGAKEKCLMVHFVSPYSFTGEDMVEFQIHGGVTVARLVLQKLLENGATLAEPGEFSKRAFENGKISLDEAESIIDEINSESEGELKAALSSAGGRLFEKIKSLQSQLTELLAEIEVSMDYPEEDEFELVREKIFNKLTSVMNELEIILSSSQESRFIRNGVNIALIGRANVGKSSLLNALLGENKAIVTSTEGTTRDIVEGSVDYKGIRFNFFDTAGIRESENDIEKIGIEKSKKLLDEADIVLMVLDGSEKLSANDEEIISLIRKPFITVVNKSDKKRALSTQSNEIAVSALNENNITELKDRIYSSVIKKEIDFNGLVVTNERQLSHLYTAKNQIEKIFEVKNESLEILSMLIKKVWNELGKITGETENEDIISVIFSKFCVGK